MALTTCNECGKQISNKAVNCVYCGTSIRLAHSSVTTSTKVYKLIAYISLALNALFIVILIYQYNSRRSFEISNTSKLNAIERENKQRMDSFQNQIDIQESQARQRLWGTGRSY